MKVATLTHEGFVINQIERPLASRDEVVIQVGACGICGTDILKATDPTFPRPAVLGHEISGIISEIGSNVRDLSVGDRVFVAHHVPCFTCEVCQRGDYSLCPHFKQTNVFPGGFSEFIKVSREHVAHTLHKIPDNISIEAATFIEPLSCCIHGQKIMGLQAGDRVLIMGVGPIGLLHLQLARANLAREVYVSDISPHRIQKAMELGAHAGFDVSRQSLSEYLSPMSQINAVIITAPLKSLLRDAVNIVARGGRIMVFSPFDGTLELNVKRFFDDEIKIMGAYSSTPYDYPLAIQLLEQQKVLVEPLISQVLPLHQIDDGIKLARESKELKILLRNSDDVLS
ncbi:MAG: alcohol dehydrogenase catalytic domain-containing protein [Thermaerobacter sp.]|nr:alcohol dehydrogenase catalytic domain-containing protein [Thermaerobacter sp.]